jgi:hypothetical protein
MIDSDRAEPVRNVQVYLTLGEAESLVQQLRNLIGDPEANQHLHVATEDHDRDLSISIVTETKLNRPTRYSDLERRVLLDDR